MDPLDDSTRSVICTDVSVPKKGSSLKKKKKTENIDRLKYEQYFKENAFTTCDKDSNELELEKLVFGGEEDILETLNSDVQVNRKRKVEAEFEESGISIEDGASRIFASKTKSRKPAWQDEDDDNILASEQTESLSENNRRGVSQKGSDKIRDLAREKFQKVTGNPKWANLDKHASGAESDDSDNELLQKSGNILKKSSSLPANKLVIRKCEDLGVADLQGGVIKSVEFHPLSRVAVTAGYSGTATLYQVDGKHNRKIQSVHFNGFPIDTAHFNVMGDELIVGSREVGHFFTYDMMYGKIHRVPWVKGMNEQRDMKRFHMSPDGKLIVVHGHFGYIHLLSAKNKECIDSLKMNGDVKAIAFNRDGSRMFSHGSTGEVYVWDMGSRTCIKKFFDEGSITGTSLALSPNEQYLAAGSDSGVVNIYDCSNGISSNRPKPLKALMNLTTEATHLKFNNTSELLAMSSSYKMNALKLVHFPSMTVFNNFPTQEKKIGYINGLDLSPNGGYIMFGNTRGTVHLHRLKHFSNY